MSEGDPSVTGWQVDYETSHVRLTDKAPDGFVPAGPWFPFGVAVVNNGEDGDCACTYYRRPLRNADAGKGDQPDDAQWVPLRDLPPGTLFEAKTGERALVSTMGAGATRTLLFSLETGAPMTIHGATLVRRLVLP